MPSWTLRRHCAGRGTDMTMIPITQYADMHGKTAVTARQMASRSGLRTAHKLGRNWMADSQEPYPDHRRRMSEAPTREEMDNPDAQQHRNEIKIAQVKQYSKVGESGGTFAASWDRISEELADQVTPQTAAVDSRSAGRCLHGRATAPRLRVSPGRRRLTARRQPEDQRPPLIGTDLVSLVHAPLDRSNT